MFRNQSARRLTRAGIVAAIYAALTLVLAPYAYGPVQIRLGEALTVLPALLAESVPGLFVGCLTANLFSGAGIYDIAFGSLLTLVAALLSRALKNPFLTGLPPVVLNALGVPLILILAGGESWAAYWAIAGSIALTQAVWVYALGLPLYFSVKRLRARGNRLFSDM